MSQHRSALVISVLVVATVALFLLAFCYIRLIALIGLANAQTRLFDEMAQKAETGSPQEAAQCLEIVVTYYPSGTKQSEGSALDHIVERARACAERRIITHLRISTGRDLGYDSHAWIETLRDSSKK